MMMRLTMGTARRAMACFGSTAQCPHGRTDGSTAPIRWARAKSKTGIIAGFVRLAADPFGEPPPLL